MTSTASPTGTGSGTTDIDELLAELDTWLNANWDPDLTVAQWWERLGLAGWAAPGLPTNAYGKGVSRGDAVRISHAIAKFGALPAPGGLGMLLAAPTIASHGTQEQIDLYVREIVTGQKGWCQLFSEPGAGSDLASLGTKAERDGDEWIINGQKVWTSGGQIADLGMLIARTDPEVPKHQGISYFAFDMIQPGVEIRPLREMTGHALFNEVFMTDARVPDAAMIGGKGNGWAVANTTLANERAGLGSGGGGAGSTATPGQIAGHLGLRAGDFVADRKGKGGGGAGAAIEGMAGGGAKLLIELAKANGTSKNAMIRQRLVQLYTLGEIGRMNGLRLKATKAAGGDVPGLPNISKLSMSDTVRLMRDLGLQIVGAAGMLHAYDHEGRTVLNSAIDNPFLGMITEVALFAQAPPIYGGTDQIQKNILGERVLGLPKEPSNDRTLPFSQLPKNT